VRALNKSWLGLALGAFLAAAGCASGNSCTDKGGTCNAGAVCPAGTELPTSVQLATAGDGAYGCSAGEDAGGDVLVCCLPTPTAK
jgi:hypothetical protein